MKRIKYDNNNDEFLKLQRTRWLKYDVIPHDEVNDFVYEIFDEIKDYINNDIVNWLDIGCGSGMINIPIFNTLQGGHIFLLDKSLLEKDKRVNSFGSTDSFGFYANLAKAKNLLVLNDIPNSSITTLTPKELYKVTGGLDLVISRFSWCFHYPYKTYSDFVYKKLNVNGRVIVDCRNIEKKNIIQDNRFRWKIIKKGKKSVLLLGEKI